MKKLLTIIAILLLLTVIYIDISTCKTITSGFFAGRTVCYLTKVAIEPGTTQEVNVELNST